MQKKKWQFKILLSFHLQPVIKAYTCPFIVTLLTRDFSVYHYRRYLIAPFLFVTVCLVTTTTIKNCKKSINANRTVCRRVKMLNECIVIVVRNVIVNRKEKVVEHNGVKL